MGQTERHDETHDETYHFPSYPSLKVYCMVYTIMDFSAGAHHIMCTSKLNIDRGWLMKDTYSQVVYLNKFEIRPSFHDLENKSLKSTHCRIQFAKRDDSSAGRAYRLSAGSVCCFLEQETFTPQKVLVVPRNRWLRLNMTEKLFTGTLNHNQNKQNKSIPPCPGIIKLYNAQHS